MPQCPISDWSRQQVGIVPKRAVGASLTEQESNALRRVGCENWDEDMIGNT